MKEKRNYKRFELIPFFAVLGCIGMVIFEGIFVFELYNRAVEAPEPSAQPAPAVEVPAVSAPAAETPLPVAPAPAAPAVEETPAPAAVPVG